MSLFDWLTKPQASTSELRRRELTLESERRRMLKRVTKLASEKQGIFSRGATERVPEVRQVLAQEFEIKTSEQLMIARQLNIRGKESMAVSRMRMIREHSGRSAILSGQDMLALEQLIESDAARDGLYQERLDEILSVGAAADTAMSAGGQAVLDAWERTDNGGEQSLAFDEADKRVREQQEAVAAAE